MTTLTRCIVVFILIVAGACSSSAGEAGGPDTTTVGQDDGREPDDADVSEALGFLSTQALPTEASAKGLIEVDRLIAKCVEFFGFPIQQEEDGVIAGAFIHQVGNQGARFAEVGAACRLAMAQLGAVFAPGPGANGALYDAWIGVYDCLVENAYPTVPPPSRAAFVENPELWEPWEAMISRGEIVFPDPAVRESVTYGPYFRSLDVCPRP